MNLRKTREEREEKKARKIPLSKYTKSGKISSLMALIHLLLLAAAVGISIAKRGNAGIYIGILVFAVLISAAAGFVIGVNSFKESDKFFRYSYIGTIANAAIWIGILGIYLTYI